MGIPTWEGRERKGWGASGCELQRMWALKTLGIKGGDDVHEALIDKIEFNGVRY